MTDTRIATGYLKSCPFCGGSAELYADTDIGIERFGVRCKFCTARKQYYLCMNSVVAAWNGRADLYQFRSEMNEIMPLLEKSLELIQRDANKLIEKWRNLADEYIEASIPYRDNQDFQSETLLRNKAWDLNVRADELERVFKDIGNE